MMILSFPLLLCTEIILHFWLKTVPDYTVNFVRIMLLIGLIAPLGGAMIAAIHATGNIKRFQLYEGTSLLLVIPIAYILLKWYHVSPETVILVYLFVEVFTQCIRIWIVLPQIKLGYGQYIKKSLFPLLLPSVCMLIPLLLLQVPHELSFFAVISYILIGGIYMALCIYFVGLKKSERRQIYNWINKLRFRNRYADS